ncbi:MAG: hypothetical protein R3C15_13325 [Thermoleophilia bacterium]
MRLAVVARDLERALAALTADYAAAGFAPLLVELRATGAGELELVARDEAAGAVVRRDAIAAEVHEEGAFEVGIGPLRELRIDDVVGPWQDEATLEVEPGDDVLVYRCRGDERRLERYRSGEVTTVEQVVPGPATPPPWGFTLPRNVELALALGSIVMMIVVVVVIVVTR